MKTKTIVNLVIGVLICSMEGKAQYKTEIHISPNSGALCSIDSDTGSLINQMKIQNTKAAWDLQFAFPILNDLQTTGFAGSETNGTHLFVAQWGYQSMRRIFRLTLDCELVDYFDPIWITTSNQGIRDMAWDGEYFYGSDLTNTIYCFSSTGQLVNTITSPVVVRSMAYDDVNDAFWVNTYNTDLTLISRSGMILDSIDSPPNMYGSAYDNVSLGGPYLWIFTGTIAGGGCQIQQYDLSSKSLTNVSHSVSIDLGADNIAGGLWSHPNIVPGKFTVGGLAQGLGIIFAYEVGCTPPVNDIGVTAIVKPHSGILAENEYIKIRILNFGTVVQSNFAINYVVNNHSPISQTITASIDPGGSYEHTFSQTVDLSMPGACYTIKVWTTLNGDSAPDNDTLSITVLNTTVAPSGIHIKLKAFVQGAYLGNGIMGTNLSQGGHMPLGQPFNSTFYAYTGSETLPVVLPEMVDWVLIDLRSTPDTIISRKAALLFSNGIIRDVNGSDSLFFSVPSGNYFIAINHRNSLTAMTDQKYSLPANGLIDFTDTTFVNYGNCLIRLPGDAMGMISGDINHDQVLKYSGSDNDRSLILQRILAEVGGIAINATTSGYYSEDLRMDGVLKYSGSQNDPSLIIQNIVALSGTNAINKTFTGSVPHAEYVPYNTCVDTLIDSRDNQHYPIVQIGSQCWMAKNLNIGVVKNSNSTGSSHSDVSNNAIIEKYCYGNDTANCAIYGGLYDWNEMMGYATNPDNQGICPTGWHIPTDAEWYTLIDYLGGSSVAGGKMKKTGTSHWYSPNTGATNSSGFAALGASYRNYDGNFYNLGVNAYFWTSTLDPSSKPYGLSLHFNSTLTGWYSNYTTYGRSVRCLRDSIPPCTPQPDQAFTGADNLNITDSCINLQANQPINGIGVWSLFSGTGGCFADSTVHNTLFTGQAGNVYTLVWTIKTHCSSSSDTVIIGFSTSQAFFCGNNFVDTRDGQQYPTVQIGTQCWMAKNLNIGTMIFEYNNSQLNNGIIEKYCYDNGVYMCGIYGGLYQWDEMMGYSTSPGTQGICPAGWHIPTNTEWFTLRDYLGGQSLAGGKLKATGFHHWTSPNTGANNSSSFTALGAGIKYGSGGFSQLWQTAVFYSSSRNIYSQAYDFSLWNTSNEFSIGTQGNGFGRSVRCLRNNVRTDDE